MAQSPQIDSITALKEFQDEFRDEFRLYTSFLQQFIPFLMEDFDIGANLISLPDCEENESLDEEHLRYSIMHRLLEEFWDIYSEDEVDPNIETIDDIVDYSFLVKVFYWYLNRKPREPSNLRRAKDVEILAQRVQRRRQMFNENLISLLEVQREATHQRIEKEASKRIKREAVIKKVPSQQGSLSITQDYPARQQSPLESEHIQSEAGPIPVEQVPIILENLGPVDRTKILVTMIDKVLNKYESRYGRFLRSDTGHNLKAILEGNLNPQVRAICDAGMFDLRSLLQIGSMEDIPGDSGVYMHILYRRSNPDHFWLYVGQALVLVVRILTHNDKAHRQANPSLHYHIWDSASDIESAFVILAKHHITQNASPDDRFILNFQEMWMACIFQTMTPKHLAEYLPDDISKAWAGQHLNVVPPIWQGFTDNISVLNEAIGGTEAFTAFINSTDPAIRAWAWDLRYAFHDLRNSPNLSHRSYYFNIMLRNRNLAEEACDRRKIAYLQSVLHGKLRIVMGGNDGQNAHRVSCSDFEFTISRRLQLGAKVGDEVMLQFQLTETLNPEMYATKASIRDPASRLAVSIKGKGANGDYFVWLKNDGEKTVMIMNSLVDALEGVPLSETRAMPRRWYVTRQHGTSKKDVVYTTRDESWYLQ